MHLRERFFSGFVQDRSIHDLIVFNFQKPGQLTREYVARVFAIADFQAYQTTEQELVDRVEMNLHPSILVHSAFLKRAH